MKKKTVLFLLRAIAAMPLKLLYGVSDFIYFVVYYLIGYRRKVVRKNLKEAFPEKSDKEISKIEKEFFRYMCDIIVETVKLLHISDTEMAKRVKVVNPELINESVGRGRSAVLLLGHYGNWEWVQEISRYITDDAFKASIYHPLKNKLWDEVYKEIRGRWKVDIVPQPNAVRALLAKDHHPFVCGFIADHRPRMIEEEAVTPFLNHHTSFIYGPEVIGGKVGADFFFLEMDRVKRGHYRIIFHPISDAFGPHPYPATREFWSLFESVIKEKPAYWLWSHKRWKYDKTLKS